MMQRPPTLADIDTGFLFVSGNKGIHTFSSGTSWDYWSDSNCSRCQFFDEDVAGELCAFESAAFMGAVSPELARLFGWTQDEQYDKPDDHRRGWSPPEQCPWFRHRDDAPAPFDDPNQLSIPLEVA